MTTPMIKLNNWLEEISLRNNVKFLRKENFICNQKLEICHIIEMRVIKYFGITLILLLREQNILEKKIHQMNWLKLD